MALVISCRCSLLFCGCHVVQLQVSSIGVLPELVVVTCRYLNITLDTLDILTIIKVEGQQTVIVLLRTIGIVTSTCIIVLICLFGYVNLAFAL